MHHWSAASAAHVKGNMHHVTIAQLETQIDLDYDFDSMGRILPMTKRVVGRRGSVTLLSDRGESLTLKVDHEDVARIRALIRRRIFA
jgi:tRNA threonylcarbamoyladenosine modification (KEOPS) complex  Pcc1 subunit